MLTKDLYWIAIAVCFLCCTGCCEKYSSIMPEEIDNAGNVSNNPQLVLGEKLKNPYSVSNMQIAYDLLSPTTKALTVGTTNIIKTTHYYVKFKPKTDEELTRLLLDSLLILYPYPLDYKVISYGSGYYRDPEINDDNQPTYYYASVKQDYIFPDNIEYEILENLFIPDDNDNPIPVRSGGTLPESFVDELVDMSLKLTGNDDEFVGTKARASWQPSGTIKYADPVLGDIGLEGIEVRAKRWFTTHIGYTDINGNYSCDGTFKRPADYSFELSRTDFMIRGDSDVPVSFGQNNLQGSFNFNFSKSSNPQAFFCGNCI